MLDASLPCVLKDALVLSDGIGTVAAREEQDIDSEECADDRGIFLEAALRELRTLQPDRPAMSRTSALTVAPLRTRSATT